MTIFAFDIETVPDLDAGRLLYNLDGLSDADVLAAMTKMRREAVNTDFQRHHLHKIVAISLAMRSDDGLAIWSLGSEQDDEPELLRQFFAGINKYQPQLVSWNGSGFDLPVINHRALINGVPAPQYWEIGDSDRDYRYNNYLSRYHWRHLDLMDVLAMYSGRANAPLDEMAQLIGLPGKMGIGGAQVAETFIQGGITEIRHYCEIDVLNTYLLFQRFELIRGQCSPENYETELNFVRDSLASWQDRNPYFSQYLDAWQTHD